MPDTLAITGGSGFIASQVVDALVAADQLVGATTTATTGPQSGRVA